MAGRKPYELKPLMLGYNLLQIALNIWLFCNVIMGVIIDKPFSIVFLQCLPPYTERHYQLTRYYVWIKLFDLVETCIFVLRKKYKQVSFLHVYHHLAIILGGYAALLLQPGGYAAFLGLANTFVHTIMYMYYFMTIYRPEVRSCTMLKRRVTQIQMVCMNFCVEFNRCLMC